MTRAALLTLALLLPASAAAGPARVVTLPMPVACVEGMNMLEGAAKLGERQILHGDTGQGGTVVVAANPETGKWTVFLVLPGTTCVIATGEALTPGPIEMPGEPA